MRCLRVCALPLALISPAPRYDEIVGKLSPFLKGTGYNMKTDVTFIPVSGFTGANIKESVDRKLAPWVE